MRFKYPIRHYLNASQMRTSVSADFPMSFLCFERRFQAELKMVKTPCSKLFNFEHDAELKNPLSPPLGGERGGYIYEPQQSPYPFALKNRSFEHRTNSKDGGAA